MPSAKLPYIHHVETVVLLGTSAPYVNRIIKNPEGAVNKTFISMMAQLGYDIELTYIRRSR